MKYWPGKLQVRGVCDNRKTRFFYTYMCSYMSPNIIPVVYLRRNLSYLKCLISFIVFHKKWNACATERLSKIQTGKMPHAYNKDKR